MPTPTTTLSENTAAKENILANLITLAHTSISRGRTTAILSTFLLSLRAPTYRGMAQSLRLNFKS